MIIVEGVDHTGKTTLIQNLVEDFSAHRLTAHKSPDKNMERPRWWAWELQRAQWIKARIYDRFFFSEYVYGPALRGGVCMSDDVEELLWAFIDAIKPLVIICEPPPADALPPIEAREQMEGVIDNYELLADRYNTVVKPMLQDHRLCYTTYKFTDPAAYPVVRAAVELHLLDWRNYEYSGH